MKRKIIFIILGFIGVLFIRCIRDNSLIPIEEKSRDLTALEKALVEADVKFGLKLFRDIVQAEQDRNIFISPLSVSMALGMAYNGSAGSTQEAMRNTLEYGDLTSDEINASFQSLIALLSQLDPRVQFQIANSIWYRLDFPVSQDFIDVNQTYFDAEVRELDFSAPEAPGIINAWVDEKTHGKIREIIDSIDPLTMLYLINAIYFKGAWVSEFDKDLTRDDSFTASDGSQIPVRMMQQENEFQYFETNDFQAIDLPYGNGKFSMTILLPKRQKTPDSLVSDFTQENWAEWMSSFSEKKGSLMFPKFKMEYEILLKSILTNLGMGIAFSEQANFTGIHENGGLLISEVIHKTFIEVDEEGTEAAAVTAVVVGATSVDPAGFTMRVDRPFVFLIREIHANTLLFMGKIVEPTV